MTHGHSGAGLRDLPSQGRPYLLPSVGELLPVVAGHLAGQRALEMDDPSKDTRRPGTTTGATIPAPSYPEATGVVEAEVTRMLLNGRQVWRY